MTNNLHPIHPMIGSIFIHVQDMKRAVEWYAKFLNVTLSSESYEMIYSMKLDNLILIFDAFRSATFQPSDYPLFSFSTDDIKKTYMFLMNNKIEVIGEIERFPDISFVTIRDSEGNLFMVVEEVESHQ